MKIYDISQEVFGCEVYPGDPSPEKYALKRMSEGAMYNLTAFRMCAHNGTHVDAPFHFYRDGKTVDQTELERYIGLAYVAEQEGDITAEDAAALMKKARAADRAAAERILVKGRAVLTADAARAFAEAGVLLYGNESQSVGPVDAPAEVHRILLGAETALLEGIRLGEVPEGVYFLNAAPVNLSGADGAPCRAVLVDMEKK